MLKNFTVRINGRDVSYEHNLETGEIWCDDKDDYEYLYFNLLTEGIDLVVFTPTFTQIWKAQEITVKVTAKGDRIIDVKPEYGLPDLRTVKVTDIKLSEGKAKFEIASPTRQTWFTVTTNWDLDKVQFNSFAGALCCDNGFSRLYNYPIARSIYRNVIIDEIAQCMPRFRLLLKPYLDTLYIRKEEEKDLKNKLIILQENMYKF